MSSSEGENFDFQDVSDSDDYDVIPKPKAVNKKSKDQKATKPPAKPKAAASKAAPKPKSAPKKQVLTDHQENVKENGMDVDSDSSADEEPSAAGKEQLAGPSKKKTASETYTKLSQLEHILKRPDSYIGSVETITQPMWTFDSENKRIAHRNVTYVPGFFKIVDEILVNAADNKINDQSMDTIKVTIDTEENLISVYNNGRGIPIEIHSTEKIYIPELIFGHLLSSSNYDDDEKKLTGGRNGYGAKLANIYSLEFTIETADKNSEQKYKQTWADNMSVCGKPKITKNAKGEEWTRVTFKPDLKRFGMEKIDEDTAGLLRKRVYDMCGTVKDIKVFLNDERLKIKGFKQYVEMYLQSAQAEAAEQSGGAAQPKIDIVYEKIDPRWEVAFAVSDGTFQHVSFANSISTSKGGTHVNYLADQIAKHLISSVTKKNKGGAAVKPAQIKNHMWLFVNALIENPTFDSQTKETMTLTSSKFGTKPTLSEDFMKKVCKSPIVENVLHWAKHKADQEIKKTDGSKRTRLTGLTKLSDANNAGTRNAKDCTLILTEGDSAKALAVAGLGVVGRDNFGVFPLRGKLLNVREAKHDQIMKNEEIQNIKKIMGLQHNKDYSNVSSLRYGRLMIMTDQDHDGSHIKGLLINFLDHFYPSLLKLPEFLVEFVTPIVRVWKGKQRKDFFTIPEYEQWVEETPGSDKWDVKYFKGLGTSTDVDAMDYFSHMSKHMIPFAPTQEGDRELIDLAFSKKKADERKEWLRQFKPGTYLDHRIEEIAFSEFINKELILFSMADNIRSIPSVADGLKPGQRKVIWGCFKRNIVKDIKVAQLVGYISEKAAYHHGEVSLAQTIVGLAHRFLGSNNMSLLVPEGQYGTRDGGGRNHASPRYLFTRLAPIARAVIRPADDGLLTQQREDNIPIEPEWYMPIIPTVLVNGAEGIGTGWSTTIPCYNPVDIVANIRRLLNDEEIVPMTPWWRGFKGDVKSVGRHKYDVTGIVRKIDVTTVEITELPVHLWTEKYKVDLEAMLENDKDGPKIKDFKEHHDNINVHFVITMAEKELEKAEEQGLIEYFKLTSKITTSNMICFDFDGKIHKYDSPEEILEAFYPVRLAYYQKRKDHMANELQMSLEKFTNQARFIQMIIDKQLVVSNRKKADIVVDLRKHKFRPFPKVSQAKEAGEPQDAQEDNDEDDGDGMDVNSGTSNTNDKTTDYDYLLGMPIYSLTKERIEKLKVQSDEKEKELLRLLEKSPKSMWTEDLDAFLKAWDQDCHDWATSATSKAAGKKGKRKPAVLKTRKSIGKRLGPDDEDDDGDFKPIKAPVAKRKPAAETTRAPKSTTKREENNEDGGANTRRPAAASKRKASTKKVVKDETDDNYESDEVVKPKPKPPAIAAAAPTKRKVSAEKKKALVKDDSDDDNDDMEIVQRDAPPKRKAAKPTIIDSESESDDVVALPSKSKGKERKVVSTDDEELSIFKPRPKDKGKGKVPEKRKSPVDDDESDADVSVKPAMKKSKITDFLGKTSEAVKAGPRKISKSMKPASPPKAKVVVESESESDDELMGYEVATKPKAGPARAARTTEKKYIEIGSDDDSD